MKNCTGYDTIRGVGKIFPGVILEHRTRGVDRSVLIRTRRGSAGLSDLITFLYSVLRIFASRDGTKGAFLTKPSVLFGDPSLTIQPAGGAGRATRALRSSNVMRRSHRDVMTLFAYEASDRLFRQPVHSFFTRLTR